MTQKPPPLRVTMANAVVGKVGNNGAGTNGAIFGQAPKKKIKFANSGIPGCRSLDGKPICTKKNFISADECERLMAHAMSPAAVWATDMPKDHQWYNRIIHLQKMPPDIRALMIQIRKRAAAAIKAEYGITRDVYADNLQLVRWPVGSKQAPHADAEEPDGSPNIFPWRAFASIIYLNEEFEGGEIHFPRKGLQPEIEAGMLAFFPSSADYLHGVNEITRGIRYTISSFYTFDESRHDGNPV